MIDLFGLGWAGAIGGELIPATDDEDSLAELVAGLGEPGHEAGCGCWPCRLCGLSGRLPAPGAGPAIW